MGVPYAEVIGDPIAHSKSPAIHKFWLEKLGIEGDYRAARVTADESPIISRHVATIPISAAATSPCRSSRRRPFRPARSRSADAPDRRRQHRDTLGDSLIGSNTDCRRCQLLALRAALIETGSTLSIVGAGGAARAAPGRDARPASADVDPHQPQPRREGRAIARTVRAALEGSRRRSATRPEADMLINASPLGMEGIPRRDRPCRPFIRTTRCSTWSMGRARTRWSGRRGRTGLRASDGLDDADPAGRRWPSSVFRRARAGGSTTASCGSC